MKAAMSTSRRGCLAPARTKPMPERPRRLPADGARGAELSWSPGAKRSMRIGNSCIAEANLDVQGAQGNEGPSTIDQTDTPSLSYRFAGLGSVRDLRVL